MTAFILALLPLVLPLYTVRFCIGPLPTTLLEVLILAALITWTAARHLTGWKDAFKNLRRHGWLIPLALWLLAGAIGIVVAPDHIAALGLWRAYFLEPVLIFVMLADILRTEKEQQILVRSLIVVCVGVAVWAVIQFVTGYGIPAPWNAPPSGIRATGPFPFPNALALFAVPIAAACFSFVVGAGSPRPGAETAPLRPTWLWFGFGTGLGVGFGVGRSRLLRGHSAASGDSASALPLSSSPNRSKSNRWQFVGVV